MLKTTSRSILAVLVAAMLAPAGLRYVHAQTPAAQPDFQARAAAAAKAIEDKRKELGIPGLSLVIVKDDKVVYQQGHGVKDAERNLPVSVDTLFAIGSCSKAFTAMSAVMAADEGKLSLEDSPKKFLPYFKLQDPEADASVTIRDLLSHRTGLDGTDLLWYTGVLTREEVIRAVALAKPTAKPGDRFQYQNVMYSAAGEAVARAQGSTWEQLIEKRFFKPLKMKDSNTSTKETLKADDFSSGYRLADKVATKVPMRDLTNIAPAGAINSNARDLAQWLRLLIGGGIFEGKRLVSESGFNELTTKQIDGAGPGGYALGWAIMDWKGHKVLAHSGGIDGFNSIIAFMPDERVGLAMLTNVSASPILGTALEATWSNIVGEPETAKSTSPEPPAVPAADPKGEVGSYVSGGLNIEVVLRDGKLIAIVPGQPEYPLLNVGGRRYKLGPPAPAGFFATFRPVKDRESDIEMLLEQPQGNLTLTRKKAGDAATPSSDYSGPMKEFLGKYEKDGQPIEIGVHNGKAALVVSGQPVYTLVEKGKDEYGAVELPDSYRVLFKRDSTGKVSALTLKQPQGESEFKRTAGSTVALPFGITVEDLMAKVVEAAGGEANIRKHSTMMLVTSNEFENQGLTGEGVQIARAPNSISNTLTFVALGKKLGSIREYFNGSGGGQEQSFGPAAPYRGRELDDMKLASDFYQIANWKTLFKTVRIREKSRVGDEEVYVVVKTPEKGNRIIEYISTSSFLVLRRDLLKGADATPATETYSDYRDVDGVKLPFTSITKQAGLGTVVTRVKEVKFDVSVPDAEFEAAIRK